MALAWAAALASVCQIEAQVKQPTTSATRAAERTAADFASISGFVLSDTNGMPLRRATVTLTSRNSGLPGAMFETTESGRFTFEKLEPGTYSISAVRDGFLPAQFARNGAFRLPPVLRLQPGESLKDVTFRMSPWAVVDGKVRFDDAEPALGVPVILYQKLYFRGRQMYRVAGQARTDDRGYFRIHGLAPGAYLLAAIYDKPARKPKAGEEINVPDREPSYASVFYPSGPRITDALPVRLAPAQELTGLDMFLEKFETVRVSGEIRDGCLGTLTSGATLEVFRTDDAGALIATNAEVRQSSGKFTIRGLGPGTYILQASLPPAPGRPGCPERSERQLLQVSAEPVDNIRLLLVNNETTRISVSTDDPKNPSFDISRYPPTLEPKTPGRAIVRPQRLSESRRLDFAGSLNAHEEYDVFFDGLPSADMYPLPPYSIAAGGVHNLRIGTRGAQLRGVVYDSQKKPVPGAVISLIPETYRPQLFREGYVDSNGVFTIQGIAPGSYIALAWMDTPTCEWNVPAEKESCRSKGKSVTVKEGEGTVLELELSNP
jgi:uncharacterized protein (DUF2141 family)